MDLINRINKPYLKFINIYKTKDYSEYTIQKKLINEGTVGKIYNVNFYKNDKLIFNMILKKQINDERNRYETYANEKVSDYVKKNKTPNFIYHYNSYCKKDFCYYFMENLSYDFSEWLNKERSQIEILAFYFQILTALYSLYQLSICHRDITHNNIMISKITNKQKYIKYLINDEEFFIRTFNKIFLLIDFGRIRSIHLDNSKLTKYCLKSQEDLNMLFSFQSKMYARLLISKLNLTFDYNSIIKKLNIKPTDKLYSIFVNISNKNKKITLFDKNEIIRKFIEHLHKNKIINKYSYLNVNKKTIHNLNVINNSLKNKVSNIHSFYKAFDIFKTIQPKEDIINSFNF